MPTTMIKGYFDRFFIPLYLAGSTGLFAVLFVPIDSGIVEQGSTPLFILTWSVFYSLTFMALLWHKVFFTRSDLFVLLIPLYFLASSLWSLQPEKTFAYSSALLCNALFAIYLCHRVHTEHLPYIIMWLIIGLCFLGLLANLAGLDATYYYDTHHRATIIGTTPIRGFFYHKISAGFFSGLAAVLSLALLKSYQRFIVFFLLVLFNLLTGSIAGFVLLTSSLVLYVTIKLALHLQVSRFWFLIAIFVFFVLVVIFFNSVGGYFLSLLHRDPTLTGRTLLWELGLKASQEKAFLGWGYFGYNGTKIAQMAALAFPEFNNYIAPHFHNSYIQYLVEAGWIFGGLFIGLYFYVLAGWYKISLSTRSTADIGFVCGLFYIIVSGFIIHTLFRYNDLSLIIFLYALKALESQRYKKNHPSLNKPKKKAHLQFPQQRTETAQLQRRKPKT